MAKTTRLQPIGRHAWMVMLLLTLAVTAWAQRASESPQPPATTQPAATQTGRVGMPSGANVAVIRIEGMIYDFVLDSLKRRIQRARNEGASMLVIELHTNGGTVSAGLAINRYLRQQPVPTVAWINDKAYSAGILIASGCDSIVMAPAAATGDCAPIVPGQELAPAERAKKLSPILNAFESSAQDNGYDYAPFHAMCQLGVEVYYIENPDTGERKLVNQVDYSLMVKGQPPAKGVVQNLLGQAGNKQQVGAVTRRVATDADLGKWRPITQLASGRNLPNGQLHDGTTLLTVSATRAADVGLSDATIASDTELRQFLKAAQVQRVQQTWSENLAGFLTSPIVQGILVVALLVGAYLEFQSPGLGIPGGIAALSLILLLGAPLIVGLADVWHVVVFLIGLGLLLIEIILIPSFGIIGIVGLLLMLVGLVMSVVPTGGGPSFGPVNLPPPEMYARLTQSMLAVLGGVAISIVAFYFLARHFGSIPMLNRLMLQDRPEPTTAGITAERQSQGTLDRPEQGVSGDEAIGEGQIHVGDTGRVSVTGLRPSGRAEINGQIIDVVSVGGWIEAGRKVQVTEVHGNRIVVDEVPRDEAGQSGPVR
jgi:membrane-bound serine protease (ClpP class)